MKAYLMFRDKNLPALEPVTEADEILIGDLEIARILDRMADGDETIHGVCRQVLLAPLQKTEEIAYRQDILRDAFQHPDTVRALYNCCVDTEQRRKNSWHWLKPGDYISSTYSTGIDYLKIYLDFLRSLRKFAEENKTGFQSEGFVNLFALLRSELSPEYLAEAEQQLEDLKGEEGILISARLGSYLQGVDYTIRCKEKSFRRNWLRAASLKLGDMDNTGFEDLGRRRDRARNELANALAQAAEHLVAFADLLRSELAFYVGCLNLRGAIESRGMPICLPEYTSEERRYWQGLYDGSLALLKGGPVTGNTLSVEEVRLYLITGANQGGKSTFLRSMGQAQLMAQCGMPVFAEQFVFPLRSGIFSHFKKEEDGSLQSGKLDEELVRMSRIADFMHPDSMILMNESFAATNEREGSEIILQITEAFLANRIEVFSVTHLFTYASALQNRPGVQALRAQRLDNGDRTFCIVPGLPTETAYGEDLYRRIFKKEV